MTILNLLFVFIWMVVFPIIMGYGLQTINLFIKRIFKIKKKQNFYELEIEESKKGKIFFHG